MDNTSKQAADSAQLIAKATGQEVGLIINKTEGLKSDLLEYLPETLYLKDALNGEVYQQIANNGNNKNLIIMHSAGNEDARKSAEILALNNANLNNNIDFISVGSPAPSTNSKPPLNQLVAMLLDNITPFLIQ